MPSARPVLSVILQHVFLQRFVCNSSGAFALFHYCLKNIGSLGATRGWTACDGFSQRAAWIIDALIAWVFMDTKRLFLLLSLTRRLNLKSTSPASRQPALVIWFRDNTVEPLFFTPYDAKLKKKTHFILNWYSSSINLQCQTHLYYCKFSTASSECRNF